jgi:hypothetical protein
VRLPFCKSCRSTDVPSCSFPCTFLCNRWWLPAHFEQLLRCIHCRDHPHLLCWGHREEGRVDLPGNGREKQFKKAQHRMYIHCVKSHQNWGWSLWELTQVTRCRQWFYTGGNWALSTFYMKSVCVINTIATILDVVLSHFISNYISVNLWPRKSKRRSGNYLHQMYWRLNLPVTAGCNRLLQWCRIE